MHPEDPHRAKEMMEALSLALDQLEERPAEAARLHAELKERVAELRALGLDLPDDPEALEAWLAEALGDAPDNLPV
ncbi:MAG: hypothetical protein JJU40_13640 [Rhodobacteraceae bacterium]|nr:hypothetical protein [Paracoccaceae bacterium]